VLLKQQHTRKQQKSTYQQIDMDIFFPIGNFVQSDHYIWSVTGNFCIAIGQYISVLYTTDWHNTCAKKVINNIRS
jgi:hypothetical protein